MQKDTKTCCHHENSTYSNAYAVYNHPDINYVVEFIENKLYFATLNPGHKIARCTENIILFNTDNELVYNSINNDFGPLNLACVYRFCNILTGKLKNPHNWHKQIVYYSSENENKRANAAFLIASFAVIFLQKTPREVDKILAIKNAPLKPFLDASYTQNLTLTLLDCLKGMEKAQKYGFFNFQDFNLSEYEKYNQMKYGDLNWILPQKFIAFVGPSTGKDTHYHPPEKYFSYFLKNGVKAIIRLNRKCYDASRFEKIGIKHYDLYMPDGTAPTRQILQEFLEICEATKGPIAVHCKAGLGRTGTLIAAYIIKHYRMEAREAVAWVRICRPGSIIAPQQKWLEEIETPLQRAGQFYRLICHHKSNSITRHKFGLYSIINKLEKKICTFIPRPHYSFKHSDNYSEILRLRQKNRPTKRKLCEAENHDKNESKEIRF